MCGWIWTRSELHRQWQEKGAPPCGHPHLDREYYNEQYPPRNPDRANTGDKVCTTCGEDFSPQELRAMGR